MRLIGAVRRLEEGAARAKVGPAVVGIVWTRNESRVSAVDLCEGEYIAVDVTVTESGVPESPARWSIQERVTLDAGDLGVFYDGSGDRIGRVVSMEPDLIRYELDEAPGVELEFLRGAGDESPEAVE